jgi:hypothetical protein
MSSPVYPRLHSHTWPPLPSQALEVPDTPPASPIPDDITRTAPVPIPERQVFRDDDAGEAAVEKPCPKLSRGGINYVW